MEKEGIRGWRGEEAIGIKIGTGTGVEEDLEGNVEEGTVKDRKVKYRNSGRCRVI